MATIDPLEHAAALLRAMFMMSCQEIELALVKSEQSLLLQISYILRPEHVRKEIRYLVANLADSTRGAERVAIRAALADFRQGINWATSASGPLAELGPVMLPPANYTGSTSTQPTLH